MTTPILKWAGGKGKLLSQIMPLLPDDVGSHRYIEPFLGGGALFLALEHPNALLGDINSNLISVYTATKGAVRELSTRLKELAAAHEGKETYYVIRERYNDSGSMSLCERAALFIYLNKTCFNGLHRVNQKGEFNVPVGSYKNPRICDPEGLEKASSALASAQLFCGSYDDLLYDVAQPHDFVYLDPPYQPVSETSNFTSYTQEGFDADAQFEVRGVFNELHHRGCYIMLSNSDTPEIRDLYHDYHIHEISAARSINATGKGRGNVGELVITNYEKG